MSNCNIENVNTKEGGDIIMSMKIKLLSFISAFILMLSIMLLGVYAANQSINLSGNINFQISDKSLWVKDVRISNDNYTEESIESFMPGYINGEFDLAISSATNQYGSFTLSFDIINTTTTSYSVNLDYSGLSSISGLEITTSINLIPAASEEITEINSQAPTTTLDIVVSNPNAQTIDLSLITITFEETTIATITNNSRSTFYIQADGGTVYTVDAGGGQLEIQASLLSIMDDSSYISNTNLLSENILNKSQMGNIELFAPGGAAIDLYIDGAMCGYLDVGCWNMRTFDSNDCEYYLSNDDAVLNLILSTDIEILLNNFS